MPPLLIQLKIKKIKDNQRKTKEIKENILKTKNN